MRESRFLVILIIISIFAIIFSITFFYIRKDKKENIAELNENMEIQDDINNKESNTSVSKEVKNYEETTNNSTNSTTNTSNNSIDQTISTSNVETTTQQTTTSSTSQTNIPQIPTLTDKAPSTTDKDSVSLEINGEANAEIFVNDWSVGFLDEFGKKVISLNTAGGDGDKFFGIVLKNSNGKSGSLNITIKKQTTSTTSAVNTTTNSTNTNSSSNTSTTTSNGATTWSYIYTNKEKFDIDDYKDDDIDELKLRDICKENRGSYTYCYKTNSLGDSGNSNLGNTKCPDNCKKGQTCLLWNKEEKSSGSLYSWVAMYRCEYEN